MSTFLPEDYLDRQWTLGSAILDLDLVLPYCNVRTVDGIYQLDGLVLDFFISFKLGLSPREILLYIAPGILEDDDALLSFKELLEDLCSKQIIDFQ